MNNTTISEVEEIRQKLNQIVNNIIADDPQYASYTCPITRETMNMPVTLSGCKHSFEQAEITAWARSKANPQCPMCRGDINANNTPVVDEKLLASITQVRNTLSAEIMTSPQYKQMVDEIKHARAEIARVEQERIQSEQEALLVQKLADEADALNIIENNYELLYADCDIKNSFYSGADKRPFTLLEIKNNKLPIDSAVYLDLKNTTTPGGDLQKNNVAGITFLAQIDDERAYPVSPLGISNALKLATAHGVDSVAFPLLLGGGLHGKLSQSHGSKVYEDMLLDDISPQQLLARKIIMHAIDANAQLEQPVTVLYFVDHADSTEFRDAWQALQKYPQYVNLPFAIEPMNGDILTHQWPEPVAICASIDVNLDLSKGILTKKLLQATSADPNDNNIVTKLTQEFTNKFQTIINADPTIMLPPSKTAHKNTDYSAGAVNSWLRNQSRDLSQLMLNTDDQGAHALPNMPIGTACYSDVTTTNLKSEFDISGIIHAETANVLSNEAIHREDLVRVCRNIAQSIVTNKAKHVAIPLICGSVFSERLLNSLDIEVLHAIKRRNLKPREYVAELMMREIMNEISSIHRKSGYNLPLQTLTFVDPPDEDNFKGAFADLQKHYDWLPYLPFQVAISKGDILEVNRAKLPNYCIVNPSNTNYIFDSGNEMSVSGRLAKASNAATKIQEELERNWYETLYNTGKATPGFFINKMENGENRTQMLLAEPGSAFYLNAGNLHNEGVGAIIPIVVDEEHALIADRINIHNVHTAVNNAVQLLNKRNERQPRNKIDSALFTLPLDLVEPNNPTPNSADSVELAAQIIMTAVEANNKNGNQLKDLYFVDYCGDLLYLDSKNSLQKEKNI